MDKVVHFEVPVDDVERAEKFYNKVFGWKLNKVPEMNYTIIHTVDVDNKFMPKEVGAINGGMMKKTNEIKNPVITINVKNIDEAMNKIKEHGGKIIMDKFNVGDMGISAYFQDTEGNVLGLWQHLR